MDETLSTLETLAALRAKKRRLHGVLTLRNRAAKREKLIPVVIEGNSELLKQDTVALRSLIERSIAGAGARQGLEEAMFGAGGLMELARGENDALSSPDAPPERVAKLLSRDVSLAGRFIRDFRALFSEPLALEVAGYGEISTVLRLRRARAFGGEKRVWVYKRMPPFSDRAQVDRYLRVYREYREILVREVGLRVPEQNALVSRGADGAFTVYAGQAPLDEGTIGNRVIRAAPPDECARILEAALGEIAKTARHNAASPARTVGLDGQISNWAIMRDADGGIEGLTYLDTSTPLYRFDGVEQTDMEVFIRNTPSILRWVIRKFVLRGVVDRYYQAPRIAQDLVANFIKEGRGELVPELTAAANRFMEMNFPQPFVPLTPEGVRKYYAGDRKIWEFFQLARRIDRFFMEKILRRKYGYRLPGAIKR